MNGHKSLGMKFLIESVVYLIGFGILAASGVMSLTGV